VVPLTGGGLSDTIVRAEVYDHSLSVEGVVVGGQRDLDPNFTLFRTDEELIVRHEYDCHACMLQMERQDEPGRGNSYCDRGQVERVGDCVRKAETGHAASRTVRARVRRASAPARVAGALARAVRTRPGKGCCSRYKEAPE
jgi:hypothetical protein